MNNLIFIIFFFVSFPYSNILTGLDVLQEDDFKLLHNKNVGLVINHTSLNRDGVHLLDLLLKYKNINIKSIFTPEHGLKGNLPAGEKFPDDFDQNSGIKIISLYGKKREPDLNDLEDLDCILFDIQDIGSRYYTYVSTLTHILNVASIANIPVIILDRPNPLGRKISGPIISKDFYSFIGMHSIPIRHGMTIGELALMINGEKWLSSGIRADIEVIELKNWDTAPGYFLIPPSPNITNIKTALIYNGMCLLEGTNLSEGRGTKEPFLLFGSPWMNSKKILKDLIELNLEGVSFYEKTFKPISNTGAKYPKYQNKLCYGIKIRIIDSRQINPLKVAVSILKIIYENHPEEFSFNNNNFIANLYGDISLKENILYKHSIDNLIDVWNKDFQYFRKKRLSYLLY